MTNEAPIVDYAPKQPATRTWGLSRPVWLLVAGFCAFVEFAGWFATNGRINGWGDIAFIVALAGIGVVALINAIRPVRQAG
jgi:hypothetical protein